MSKIKYLIIFTVLLSSLVFSQSTVDYKNNIAINFGYSKSFVIDEYISPNEYSGGSIFYGLTWGDNNYKRIVQIDVSFNKINNLTNNLSKATNSNFFFNYRHIFFISKSFFFSKQFNFYLGPGLSIFFSDRSQNNIPMNSQIGFISVDLNAKSNLLLSEKFSLSAQLLFSGLSFGNKSQSNSTTKEKSDFEILSLFSLQNLEFNVKCKYYIVNFIFVQSIYSFNYIGTSNWDYFRMLGDKISFQLGISF